MEKQLPSKNKETHWVGFSHSFRPEKGDSTFYECKIKDIRELPISGSVRIHTRKFSFDCDG